MGQYDFRSIEPRWQAYWRERRVYAAEKQSARPKYYVLDMFPYPSGSGLHVGHPLGYIATDIVSRYKRNQGFNVMHPMGYDAFGLPAEQYAIDTGQHPAVTTEQNIRRYEEQLSRIGLAYDPDSFGIRTCDPGYYRWTQWVFLQIFNSWFNLDTQKAEPIDSLCAAFAAGGSEAVRAFHSSERSFTAAEWNALTATEQQQVLTDYRLAYPGYALVNWCEALGTVLANDEVINGVSERGGHPVERKQMRQWQFRMTAYADRLLHGLDGLDWPEALKEQQRNWIGRSEGASVRFSVAGRAEVIEVFTTRPDTIYGSTFMVLAPEHPLTLELCTPEQRATVEACVEKAKNRSEVERMADVKTVTGAFTGAYAVNPFTGKNIPVWTGEYVLWGYGTGAIMAVPGHDERDYAFARHFGLDIVEVVAGGDISREAFVSKEGTLVNSDILNGMEVKAAIRRMVTEIETRGLGRGKVNFRLRDPNFSRQRYWGEPFPIVWRDGAAWAVDESELPVLLPETSEFTPTGSGEGPLSRLESWVNTPQGRRETNTMPGYAGSSWYFLRYLDPKNDQTFCDKPLADYWMSVDLYVGGSEHAVGHLLYSRFWTKVLCDLGHIQADEPFRKLVNQGMIQGQSCLVHRIEGTQTYVTASKASQYATTPIHTDIRLVDVNGVLDLNGFRAWRAENADADFILEDDGRYLVTHQIEKMGKRYHNAVNPDDICRDYGADTFRLYEMFLGPLEVSKPFILNGIEGVAKFLRQFWNLFTDEANAITLTDEAPSAEELKVLHTALKKVTEDIENLSFNTAVPALMIFKNEMQRLNCRKRAILEPVLVAISPFAPHLAEELWQMLGHTESITRAPWPQFEEKYLKASTVNYPLSINGKVKGNVTLDADLTKEQIEGMLGSLPEVAAATGGQPVKRAIVVPGRIINLVI